LTLKGKAQPVPAHRLVRLTGPGRAGRRHDLPLVGRDAELETLRSTFRSATRGHRCLRATLIGDAGAGKSRLTHEFVAEASRIARVVQGSCLPYGDGVTFWPLLEVVHDAAGIEEGDDSDTARARLDALIGDEPDVLERMASIAGLVTTPY